MAGAEKLIPGRGQAPEMRDGGVLRRVFRNAGVLMSGRAAAGLLGFAALAVTARGLGPELFGVLALVHSYTRVIAGLIKFQSWQAVIRYGAQCLVEDRRRDLQRLLVLTTALDVVSAVVGMAVAMALAPLIAPLLGLSADQVHLAVLYSAVILVSLRATPVGTLRLFDRFDLSAAQNTVRPAVQLVGAAIAFASGGGLGAFLLVWFLAAVLDNLTLLFLGWREAARHDLVRGIEPLSSLRGVSERHPGVWRFVWTTNFNTSLATVLEHVSTLAVGWVLGPAPAGLFRIATRVAKVLETPATMLRQTIYPELAKLAAGGGRGAIGGAALRAGVWTGAAAALALIVLALLGETVLRLTAGVAFVAAYGVMMLLAVATAIKGYGLALGPVMLAIGRPDLLFKVNLVLTLLFVPLLIVLLANLGLIGAGIATVAHAAIGITVLTILATRKLAAHAP